MENQLRQELEAFWDDFAKEYQEIQKESPFPIATDLAAYLLKENYLPEENVIDLAGGVGRFIPELAPLTKHYLFIDFSKEMLALAKKAHPFENVTFLHEEQGIFLTKFPKVKSSLLFSAMNPDFIKEDTFREFYNYPCKKHLILRLTKDSDSLFTPYEKDSDPLFPEKDFLQKWQQPFKEVLFSYKEQEEVSKEFFETYFKDNYSSFQLEKMIQKNFSQKKTTCNQRQVVYTLLIF